MWKAPVALMYLLVTVTLRRVGEVSGRTLAAFFLETLLDARTRTGFRFGLGQSRKE